MQGAWSLGHEGKSKEHGAWGEEARERWSD